MLQNWKKLRSYFQRLQNSCDQNLTKCKVFIWKFGTVESFQLKNWSVRNEFISKFESLKLAWFKFCFNPKRICVGNASFEEAWKKQSLTFSRNKNIQNVIFECELYVEIWFLKIFRPKDGQFKTFLHNLTICSNWDPNSAFQLVFFRFSQCSGLVSVPNKKNTSMFKKKYFFFEHLACGVKIVSILKCNLPFYVNLFYALYKSIWFCSTNGLYKSLWSVKNCKNGKNVLFSSCSLPLRRMTGCFVLSLSLVRSSINALYTFSSKKLFWRRWKFCCFLCFFDKIKYPLHTIKLPPHFCPWSNSEQSIQSVLTLAGETEKVDSL